MKKFVNAMKYAKEKKYILCYHVYHKCFLVGTSNYNQQDKICGIDFVVDFRQ